MKRNRILALLAAHGPSDWETQLPSDILTRVLRPKYADPLPMIVLAADIRDSTSLMREAKSLAVHANHLSEFAKYAKRVVHQYHGWFDKFLGDGFIAYWPYAATDAGIDEALRNAFGATFGVQAYFEVMKGKFRNNARNFSCRVNICFGLDAGVTHLLLVADDLTVLGPTVVGATRMVSAAEPGETLCNVAMAGHLDGLAPPWPSQRLRVTVQGCCRKTKDYPSQEAYVVDFESRSSGDAVHNSASSTPPA